MQPWACVHDGATQWWKQKCDWEWFWSRAAMCPTRRRSRSLHACTVGCCCCCCMGERPAFSFRLQMCIPDPLLVRPIHTTIMYPNTRRSEMFHQIHGVTDKMPNVLHVVSSYSAHHAHAEVVSVFFVVFFSCVFVMLLFKRPTDRFLFFSCWKTPARLVKSTQLLRGVRFSFDWECARSLCVGVFVCELCARRALLSSSSSSSRTSA